ncbi:MAG TPA: hypothetical protein VM123_09550 [archaeon]|nr:hypothetical protein [archaeon]
METIIVPVDGASQIKLEVLDFDTLTTVFSRVTETPVKEVAGLKYNAFGEECSWFDSVIRELPESAKTARVIAPVARGASAGLVGPDNTLTEVPGQGLALAYTQEYPDRVEDRFRELAGSSEEFYQETGSILDFPGSLTLMKRFVFEDLERPETLSRTACFGTYGILLSGHFLGDDYLKAVRTAGNEHSYWMCHTGARDIGEKPGTPSFLSLKIKSFRKLVPQKSYSVYWPLGIMPQKQAASLGLSGGLVVIPGGHDTCLSHIPIMSTFYQTFAGQAGIPVVHLEAGTWTMVSQIGAAAELPPDGYKRGILVQGTVDGNPVVTSLYGGGNDFKYLARLVEERGAVFESQLEESLLEEALDEPDCFVLPNINPVNYLTGPFPQIKGKIINRHAFLQSVEKAFIIANLSTSIVTACQVSAIAKRKDVPIVLTAGGSRDPYYGRLVATLTGRDLYAMYDRNGQALSETTTLGAAIAGKAACLKIHPYQVDMRGLGIQYRKLEPFNPEIAQKLFRYRELFMKELEKAAKRF